MSPLFPVRCRSAEGRNAPNSKSRHADAIRGKGWAAEKWRTARPLAEGVALLLVLLGLAACSSSQPIEKQSALAASAGQTATMVVDAWASGAAPTAYASATLQSMAESLAAAGRQIQSDNSQGRAVVTAIGQLSAATRQAQAGVEAGNPRQASQAQHDLRMAAADLEAAAKPIAPKS